jgi:H+/Cl- antiporter ClcA
MQGHYSAGLYALIGVVKLFAITITLLAGFRGGFIFPLFTAGTALGTAIQMVVVPLLPAAAFPPVVFAMAFASGLNTSITRTPLSTPLILMGLSGQPGVAVPCLAAACVALVLTQGTPFIMTQQSRDDIQTPFSSSSKQIAGMAPGHETLETPAYH